MARLTTVRRHHRRRHLPRPVLPGPVRVCLIESFAAKGAGRHCRIDRETITIELSPWLRFLGTYARVRHGKRRGEPIPTRVAFTVDAIAAVRWRPRIGPFRPVMILDVPGANDRWCAAGLWGGSRPHRIKARTVRRQHIFWLALAILYLRPELRTHPWKGFPKLTGKPPVRDTARRSWWARTFGTRIRYMRAEMGGAPRRRNRPGRFKVPKPVRRAGGHTTDHHHMQRSR